MRLLCNLLLLCILVAPALCVHRLFPRRDTYIDQQNPTTSFYSTLYYILDNRDGRNTEALIEFDTSPFLTECAKSMRFFWAFADGGKLPDSGYYRISSVTPTSWSNTTTWNDRSSINDVMVFTGAYNYSSVYYGWYDAILPSSFFEPAFTTWGGKLNLRISHTFSPTNWFKIGSSEYYVQGGSMGPFMDLDSTACSTNAACISGSCVCNSGFSGNGNQCYDMNDCALYPCSNGATCTDTGANSYKCTCAAGYNGTNCEININECASSPCKNGATCTDKVNGYECACVTGYSGKSCDININDCQNNPCLNGGTCVDGVNAYTCSCAAGYSGSTCQTVTNNCGTSPCQNGGTCVNQPTSYTCTCQSGFNGINCQNNINDCTSTSCKNGGACTDGINTFTCNCAGTGFSGTTCEINVNDCTGNQCQNGATCVDGVNSYTCSCVSGYSGQYCQTNINECQGVTCQNGGTCVDGINSYSCSCPTGWGGPLCQTMVQCPSESHLNALFQSVQAGSTAAGSCAPGYQGTPSRECLMPSSSSVVGVWSSVSSPCILRYCDATLTESMSFQTTQAGKYATSLCASTYSSIDGKATRYCNLDGKWEDIVNPCTPIYCLSAIEGNVNWTETRANSTFVYGICESGYAGLPHRSCDSNGQWLSIQNPCEVALYPCEPDIYDNALWGRSSGGKIAQSVGCIEGYTGLPTRECNANGTWSSIVDNPCLELPKSPSNLTLVSSTSDSLTLEWDYPYSLASSRKKSSESITFDILLSTNKQSFFVTNNGLGSNFNGTTFTVAGLQQFSKYTIRVYSLNENGRSSSFAEKEFTTDLTPPSNLRVSNITFNSVLIKWTVPTLVEWVHIFVSTEENIKNFAIGGFQFSGSNEFVIRNLSPLTGYNMYVHSGRGTYFESIGSSIFLMTTQAPTEAPTQAPTESPTLAPTTAPTESPTSQPTESPTNSPTNAPTSSPSPTEKPSSSELKENSNLLPIIIGASAGGLCLLFLNIFLIIYLRRRRTRKFFTQSENEASISIETFASLQRNSSTRKTGEFHDDTLMNTILEVSLPGFLLLDYLQQIRKEDKIGEGGCAIIYKGVLLDVELAKRYNVTNIAIKELFVSNTFTLETEKDRFKQEIAVMWSLNFHPNIVKLLGYCESPWCIITQLYDGDLTSLVYNTSADLSPVLALSLLKDIASGMLAIHTNEIVHRDLKTSNILIETKKFNGSDRVVVHAVICDFGIARVASDAKITSQKFIDVKGMSPRYTAPEVFARNLVSATAEVEEEKKSDVYSFGIITWELLTRQRPWDNLGIQEIEISVRTGVRPPMPENKTNPISTVLMAVAEVAWKQSPGERPSFKEIHNKLHSITY